MKIKQINKPQKDLNEKIEKHNELNPKLFDKNILKPEVRDKVEDIVNEFLKILNDEEIALKVKDVILAGSNASFNYTDQSDVDVHIVADTQIFDENAELYQKLYNAYRRIFENKYDINFYGIPVELYVESAENPVVSNGVYSIMNNHWVKFPEITKIPDIDQKEIDAIVKPWEEKYKTVVTETEKSPEKGEEMINNFLNSLYEMRHLGIKEGGEFSPWNLAFKSLRSKGYLEKLRELKVQIINDRLSLEENRLTESLSRYERNKASSLIEKLINKRPSISIEGDFKLENIKLSDLKETFTKLKTQPYVEWFVKTDIDITKPEPTCNIKGKISKKEL